MESYYQMGRTKVRETVNGSPDPLSDRQVLEHQKKYGPNELKEEKKKSAARIFLEQFKDLLVLILIAAAVVSGFLGDLESTIVIFAVVLINAALGTVQTIKAEQSLKGLKALASPEAKVLRNGNMVQIPSAEVTVGDEVMLEAGDYVPADGRMLQSASLKVDESALTGESMGVDKTAGKIADTVPLGDQTNMVFSGSFVTYGRGSYLVTEVGMETEVGKIAKLLKATSEKKTPLQVSLDQFGQKLSVLVLVFCALLFGISVIRGESIGNAFLFAVALAVAAIPEALSSIVTIVLSFGTQKMAKEHAIIRKISAVEGLGSVSIICSDKTGTLTQNKMTVEDYYVEGKRIPVKEIETNSPEQEQLLYYSFLCNDAAVTDDTEIGDPTETALVHLGRKLNIPAEKIREHYPRTDEIPFDSDRKLMTVACRLDQGLMMITKGAVDVLVNRLSYIQKDGKAVPVTQEDKEDIENQNRKFSKEGLRVLAFAYRVVPEHHILKTEDEKNMTFLGLISMMDPPREESKEAVKKCIQAGIKPVMITGDHKITASSIAKRIGILEDEKEACEGTALDAMTDEELGDFVENISVYARVSPEHKIRIVKAWQEKGNVVAMTGDGVNDAPALKQADIGIAMGITGTEVSKDAASMVLTDDNFATIIKAVENGRNVYRNIKHSIQFLLSGNFGAIFTVLFAAVVALPVPFAPVHLLFINLLTDSLPAIALGLEPHTKKVMEEKPKPADESILTKNFLFHIGTEGFVIGVLTILAFLIGFKDGNQVLASTMAFGTLCTARLVHGFNCKSDYPVIFSGRLWNNRYLIGAFLFGLTCITGALLIPGLQKIFHVQTLQVRQLLTVYGLAFINLPVVQLLKKATAR